MSSIFDIKTNNIAEKNPELVKPTINSETHYIKLPRLFPCKTQEGEPFFFGEAGAQMAFVFLPLPGRKGKLFLDISHKKGEKPQLRIDSLKEIGEFEAPEAIRDDGRHLDGKIHSVFTLVNGMPRFAKIWHNQILDETGKPQPDTDHLSISMPDKPLAEEKRVRFQAQRKQSLLQARTGSRLNTGQDDFAPPEGGTAPF